MGTSCSTDVFREETYRPSDPARDLRALDNVLLSPHAGPNTREANARMAEASVENVRAFFSGRHGELSRVD